VNDDIRSLLDRGGLIDITTKGRTSGEPRRLEIVVYNVGGQLVISGMPIPGRTRAWIHNLEADPRMTVHVKGPLTADLAARGRVVTDEAERTALLVHVARNWNRDDVDQMVKHSPLIVVSVPGYDAAAA